jgi:F-type H+-transporting ATPase subunit delta
MTSETIVNRYANALADVIVAPGSVVSPALAVAQLRGFDTAAQGSPDLNAILSSPAVPRARKRIVIRAIAEALGLNGIIVNFLLVLSDRRRWSALHEVIEALDGVLDDHLGFERAEVSSAYELSEQQRAELTRELARVAGRQIRLRHSVDPNLIGGVTAKLGSTVYDGSVRGQLAKMRQGLAASRY